MDEVKKKVFLDLFASPSTVLPVVGGLSAWMLSWAVDGNLWLNLGGLVGLLGGCGLLATRWIFGLEEITEQAHQYLHQQEHQQQQRALDALEHRLRGDQDPRTQTYLRRLRALHQSFQDDVERGKLSGPARSILAHVEKLFQAAVKHLQHSYHLWETAARLSGPAGSSIQEERERVIQEVRETIDHLGHTIEQFHCFQVKQSETELAKLRRELDETMRVARRAEDRVAAIGREKDYGGTVFE